MRDSAITARGPGRTLGRRRCSRPPRPIGFLGRDGLDGGDDVLQLGDLSKGAPGRQPVMFRHGQDERALVRLQALEEGVEFFGHGRAVDAMARINNLIGVVVIRHPQG